MRGGWRPAGCGEILQEKQQPHHARRRYQLQMYHSSSIDAVMRSIKRKKKNVSD